MKPHATLSAFVDAVNTAHLACHLVHERAQTTVDDLIGKVVHKKNHRPNERTLARLAPIFASVHDHTHAKIYTPEGRCSFWVEAMAHASTPQIGVVYHRAAFTLGDVDDSGRLTKLHPAPTHLRHDWTVADVERLLADRRAAEGRAREARAALGPFQDYRY